MPIPNDPFPRLDCVQEVHLRPITSADLPALYEFQADPLSNDMAGTKPRSREVFFAVWERHFADPRINARVIEIDTTRKGGGGGGSECGESGGGGGGREIVGSIACFQADGRDGVGYWIARAHWGRGIASQALAMFLKEEPRRPLHATAASANATSQRILKKCGFRFTGMRMGEETERFVAREIADFVLE